MDLLYMPLLELQQHLKQELLGNPFLELVEPGEETEVQLSEDGKEAEKEKAGDDEPTWEDILLDDGSDQGVPPRDMSEAREYVEPVPVETKDLSDYLRDQVRLLDLTPRQQLLAEEFIGNIAEDGYLGATPEEIVRGANQLLEEHAVESEQDAQPQLFTIAEAEEMLRIIQDRKSTRLNSSHLVISYAVFCLKKKKQAPRRHRDPRRPWSYIPPRRGAVRRAAGCRTARDDHSYLAAQSVRPYCGVVWHTN